MKLWRAYGVGPAHDGLALYCKSSQWVPVCDDSWTCDTGRLFCKKLGYAGVLSELKLMYIARLIIFQTPVENIITDTTKEQLIIRLGPVPPHGPLCLSVATTIIVPAMLPMISLASSAIRL